MSWTLSVSELNEYVRKTLAGDPLLHDITLRGEISNFKPAVSGHWYFTLKDENSRISCCMFRSYSSQVRFMPKDGMKVLLNGSVGLYTAGGTYQFIADGMKQEGTGDLYERFQLLKKRLFEEGLFDPAKKRPLPMHPRAVGIVTSRTGAVVHDIMNVAGRRDNALQLILRPAQVQGEGAAEDIAAGIRELGESGLVDVIIVGRGGGSLEDLWAFNEEIVARAVAACPVPVVSAVGHETDFTICDFTADLRAPTPSAAAELCVPERAALERAIEREQRLLRDAAEKKLLENENALHVLRQKLSRCHPLTRVKDMTLTRERLRARLDAAAKDALARRKTRAALLESRLLALGPGGALRRGYSVVMKEKHVVRSVKEITPGEDTLTLLMKDGTVTVKAVEVREGEMFS